MNLIELQRLLQPRYARQRSGLRGERPYSRRPSSLRQLRLGGIAAVLENRLRQAQAQTMAPIDLISCLVSDELTRRSERLLDRRRKQSRISRPAETPR